MYMHLNLQRTETLLYRETNNLTKIRLYDRAHLGYEHASKNVNIPYKRVRLVKSLDTRD